MKNKVRSLLIVLVGVFTFSCSTSNDVAGKFGIQKRKYTKGFSISKNKKYNLSKTTVNQEVLAENTTKNETPLENATIEPVVKQADIVKEESTPIISKSTFNSIHSESLSTLETVSKSTKKTKTLTFIEQIKPKKIKKTIISKVKETFTESQSAMSDEKILYFILAILLPPVAVGLVTDWDILLVVVSIVLTLIFILPGIIHAIIVVNNRA